MPYLLSGICWHFRTPKQCSRVTFKVHLEKNLAEVTLAKEEDSREGWQWSIFPQQIEVGISHGKIWVFPRIRDTPKWMVYIIMENPIKMDDLGVPLFLETPISIKSQSFLVWRVLHAESERLRRTSLVAPSCELLSLGWLGVIPSLKLT